jgi:hypothetical protein
VGFVSSGLWNSISQVDVEKHILEVNSQPVIFTVPLSRTFFQRHLRKSGVNPLTKRECLHMKYGNCGKARKIN